MASDWEKIRLGKIVDFAPKRTIKKGKTAPFISMADVTENSKLIKEVFAKEYTGSGSRFANGDTLFARITPCLQNGKCSKVSGMNNTEIGHGSTEFIVMAAKMPKYDEDYIYYLARLPKFRAYAESRMIGSTGRQRVSWQDLEEYEFFAPLPNERKDIGAFLSSLDDKIELNRQMNETLEAMAQALFKSWFVDFDPVIDNAIKAGKPIPDELAARAKLRKNIIKKDNPEIQCLFPDEFEFTEELGWIPKGWVVDSIKNLIVINPITTLKKGTVASYADMKALPESGYSIDGIIQKAYSGGTKFENRDVLFARITPCLENGKTGIVDFLKPDEVGFGSTEFIVLREKNNIKMEFVACLARNLEFRLHAQQSMVGSSGRQRVQNDCFSSFYLALPRDDDRLLNLFNKMTAVNFTKISISSDESKILANLRDTLLPKLMSGEIRVSDAAAMVEDA